MILLSDGKTVHNAFLIETSGRAEMKIQYFADTDTALIDFIQKQISETKEISENIYIDVDNSGNLVRMTIEHAKQTGSLEELVYKEVGEAHS